MPMSKKDFEILADALAQAYEDCGGSDTARTGVTKAVVRVAQIAAAHNRRFSWTTFYDRARVPKRTTAYKLGMKADAER